MFDARRQPGIALPRLGFSSVHVLSIDIGNTGRGPRTSFSLIIFHSLSARGGDLFS